MKIRILYICLAVLCLSVSSCNKGNIDRDGGAGIGTGDNEKNTDLTPVTFRLSTRSANYQDIGHLADDSAIRRTSGEYLHYSDRFPGFENNQLRVFLFVKNTDRNKMYFAGKLMLTKRNDGYYYADNPIMVPKGHYNFRVALRYEYLYDDLNMNFYNIADGTSKTLTSQALSFNSWEEIDNIAFPLISGGRGGNFNLPESSDFNVDDNIGLVNEFIATDDNGVWLPNSYQLQKTGQNTDIHYPLLSGRQDNQMIDRNNKLVTIPVFREYARFHFFIASEKDTNIKLDKYTIKYLPVLAKCSWRLNNDESYDNLGGAMVRSTHASLQNKFHNMQVDFGSKAPTLPVATDIATMKANPANFDKFMLPVYSPAYFAKHKDMFAGGTRRPMMRLELSTTRNNQKVNLPIYEFDLGEALAQNGYSKGDILPGRDYKVWIKVPKSMDIDLKIVIDPWIIEDPIDISFE